MLLRKKKKLTSVPSHKTQVMILLHIQFQPVNKTFKANFKSIFIRATFAPNGSLLHSFMKHFNYQVDLHFLTHLTTKMV